MRDLALADLQFVHEIQTKKSSELCRQFLKGECSYGQECKYTHAIEAHFPPFHRLAPFEPAAPRPWPLYAPSDVGIDFSAAPQPHNHALSVHYSTMKSVSPSSLEWRTAPCRHYTRNKGWCPLGDDCNFVHDLDLQCPYPVTGTQPHVPSNLDRIENREADVPDNKSNPKPSIRSPLSSHCWAHVQSRCRIRGCRHFHPQDVRPYMKYTPCPGWLACPAPLSCPFKHPEAIHLLAMPPSILAPIPQSVYIEPSILTLSNLIPMEVDGTTYYPVNTAVSTTCSTAIDQDDLNRQVPSQSFFSGLDFASLAAPSDMPMLKQKPHGLEVVSDALMTGEKSTELETGSLDGNTKFPDRSELRNRVPKSHRPGHARRYSVPFKAKSSIDASISGYI
ncbi:hypothetical protein Hypma_009532 [Hypsizygus marmoreus]|uniref:C3H1-type domain-containing protein n=1 Tax=Hypsizygus marmoreus TaxID=39966 RepID=A0A369JTK5_HYPMA|nr:hypothetical protein Hypma_009532 [Hypsizygus marmoreus]